MQFNLVPHPSSPPSHPFKLWVNVEHSGMFGATASASFWFALDAPADRFVIPTTDSPDRREGLWRTTCFEAFLREEGEEVYQEWNFAPSSDWAAYDFIGRRERMTKAEVANPPYIRMEDNLTWWTLGATIAVETGHRWELGLSAVIEETDGTKSYWALAHRGDKPDFHDPACFTARLA